MDLEDREYDDRVELVKAELFHDVTKGEQRELRRDPGLWYDTLGELIASLQSQMSRVNVELDEFSLQCEEDSEPPQVLRRKEIEVAKWKAAANAILLRAQARRGRVKQLVNDAHQAKWEASNAAKVAAAVEAIDRHRRDQEATGDEPSDADVELWEWADRLRDGEYDQLHLQQEGAA